MNFGFLLTATVGFVLVVFVIMYVLARIFVRCPANRVLVIQGALVGHGRSSRCINGGLAFVWPAIQQADFLDLTPMVINIPLKGALSQQNIRVNVPSAFTIAIDHSPDGMLNAATRLLGLSQDEIESKASEVIFGQLRLTIASLTIEEINQNRDRFAESIRGNIDPELKKFGLCLLNVNITDITDESGYIESIGKKAASTAVNQAKIDVATQEKLGEIGKAEADKERRIQVATYNAQAVEGENQAAARIAAYNADLAEKNAEAERRGQVANQVAIGKIQAERAVAETKRLEAEEVVPREIDKRKIEIAAEAEAQKRRKEAAGEADAIVAVKTAEAQGILAVLNSKAQGYHGIVHACGENSRDAAGMLLVEKLEEVVKLQTEAVRNIKIDKITVWDSASGDKGSATANFMSSMVQAIPPLHDVARMAGVELPDYLGHIQEKGKKEAAPAKQP
jgi:flotillin